MAMLEVDNLSVHFRTEGGIVEAVNNVSFELNKGEILALVGESGSGKTVTALSLLQLLPYPTAFHPTGHIRHDGLELVNATEAVIRSVRGNKISMVFQEPMTALNPLHTIGRQIKESILLHQKLTPSQVKARLLELLEMVGLSHFKERLDAYPHQLSGGERQRVMIAMAIANSPDILVADEPTTALDVTIQAQILELLKSLQAKLGMAVLLITHDLTIVRKIANRVAVMQKGNIVETGKVEDVFKAPKHPYTAKLLNSEPSGSAAPVSTSSEALMGCKNLAVAFVTSRNFLGLVQDERKVLNDISLTITPGTTIGIVGESGSGKTTLGLALLRLLKSKGEIVFGGKAINGLPASELRPLRKDMQMVFQDPYSSLNPRLTVGQIIAEGLDVHYPELGDAERITRVDAILQEVGLTAEMKIRYPHEFSGGQRQRISIARALILNPKLIVLDEPTSALDLSIQAQLIALLKSLQQKHGIAYLFISHDLRVVRALAHHVIVLRHGSIVEEGDTESLFKSPKDPYTQALIEAAFPKAA